MSDTVDKIGATLTVFFLTILIGYSAAQAGMAALVTWVVIDVVFIIRMRGKTRRVQKDREE